MKVLKTNLNVLLRLVQFTWGYKWKIFLLIFLGLIGVGLSVINPLPMKFIIDNVLSGQPLSGGILQIFNFFGGVPDRVGLLIIFVSAAILIGVGNAILGYASTQVTTKVCQRLVMDLSVQLFDKLQRMSLSFYSKSHVGELMQRLSGDTYVVSGVIAGILLPTLFSIVSLFAMFYIMLSINVTLALLAISIVPFFAVLLKVFKKPIITSGERQYEESAKLWSFIQQSLTSIKIVQAYSRENFTRDKYRTLFSNQNDASIQSTKISTIYNTLTGLLSGTATALIIGIGAYKGLGGEISIGELYVFIGYIGALFGPVNSLASIVQQSMGINVRGKRVFEILDSEEIIYEKPNAVKLTDVQGHIKFKDVSFGYNNNGLVVLENFNLEIDPGQIVAIVGPTGAGKTSMISMLLRFYDPWQGEVSLDGVNLKDLTLESLRSNITLVLQDSFIFPMSLADNIAFANPNASREEIIKAAKAAQAHDFISRLPEGYDTIASEGGVSLSGGEKQRISLARAFLRNTSILILDEPTSALDAQTEARIFQSLSSYSKGRTIFIISHRLSTIRHADLIVTIKDGMIAEKGTHEVLVNEGKVYAELYKYQEVD
ncbi:ABC transporter ATP-binding protein [Nibrella saemangeumensis]|uniref:ABC transporter ATP-binding protein n=1 Tax=Nibrella saemangeumensis TaxID=1084526 RepID=A0ABP8MNX4_9BACT